MPHLVLSGTEGLSGTVSVDPKQKGGRPAWWPTACHQSGGCALGPQLHMPGLLASQGTRSPPQLSGSGPQWVMGDGGKAQGTQATRKWPVA